MVADAVVSRGEVWWVDFGEPFGSEPGYRRPVVIVSSDRFNDSRINTVMVSLLSSNPRLAAAPGNVALAAGTAGLPKASVVNVSRTTVIDRVRLAELIGSLDSVTMQRVSDGLKLFLAL